MTSSPAGDRRDAGGWPCRASQLAAGVHHLLNQTTWKRKGCPPLPLALLTMAMQRTPIALGCPHVI